MVVTCFYLLSHPREATARDYHGGMSDYVARYLKEYAELEPLPRSVLLGVPWGFWVVILPVTILLLSIFTV